MLSTYIFYVLVLAIAIQRLFEVHISKRNEERILLYGGKEHAPKHFIAMKAIHIAWILAMPLEVFIFERTFSLTLFIPAFLLVIAGQSLRYLAITTLKDRWTVRIMTVPNAGPVTEGIFKYIRHPNYVGVVLEIFAFPLLHSAYLTSLIFSVANGILLYVRIGEEEKALNAENNYYSYFLIPPLKKGD